MYVVCHVHSLCCAGDQLAAPPAPAANEPEDVEAANPWAMLLRTFLPWVNAGQVPDYDQQEDEEPEGGRDDSQDTSAIAIGAGEEVVHEAYGAHAAGDEEDDLD